MSSIEQNTKGLGTIDLLKVMLFLLVGLFVLIFALSDSIAIKTAMPTLTIIIVALSGIFAGFMAVIRLLYDIKWVLISRLPEKKEISDTMSE